MTNTNTNTNIIRVDLLETKDSLHYPLVMHDEEEEDDDDLGTGTSALDYKGRPAVRSKHGRWRSAFFIIVVEMGERTSHYAVAGNLITFMTEMLGQPIATAAVNVNTWIGVTRLLPILGGVIADSLAGKFYTIIVASLLYILGMGLLTLSAVLPSWCINNITSTESNPACTSRSQLTMFFVALYLVAIGQSGHRPCLQAFGADQFDANDAEENKTKSSFFNWWYVGLCMGGLLGTGVLSFVQDNLGWGFGFGIPCFIMILTLVIFLIGTKTYRYMAKGDGPSQFLRIGRVYVSAAKNWCTSHSSLDNKGEERGVRTQLGYQQFRFLNKALLSDDCSKGYGEACKISDVEEAKAMLRLFPIWASSLIFAIINSQVNTFFVKQGATLDRSIGPNFSVPAAGLQVIISVSVIIIIPIYDRAFVPITRSFTGKPVGITQLQRIGIGFFVSIITMVIAALVEQRRLQTAIEHGLVNLPNATIPMSLWWLVPQYALFGTSEAFTMVGLQEFFYDQVPNELSSVGMALYLSILGVGNLLSSLLVSIINKTTRENSGESWFSDNLNRSHLDYFYWLLAGFSVFGLIIFSLSAKFYIYNKKNTGIEK